MRLYFLLAISSILMIGCSGKDIIDEAVSSPAQTSVVTVETITLPTLPPITSPFPTAVATMTELAPTVSANITAPPAEESTPGIWLEYVNEAYGFGFRYPNSWTLIELQNRPNQVSLVLPGTSIALRIGFRHSGEDAVLQQYGGAAGDFVSKGTIDFLGEEIEKAALVFEGVEKEIHYNGTSEIIRGDIFFTMAVKSNQNHEKAVIPEEIQAAADEIISTFKLLGEQE